MPVKKGRVRGDDREALDREARWEEPRVVKKVHHHHHGGALYFLGMIGAAVYFLQHATGWWGLAVALLKALVWPAFLVYRLLGLTGL